MKKTDLTYIKFTRTEETKKAYVKRAESLILKARKELNIASYLNFDVRQFVGWLIANRNNLAKASWRQYRSSVMCYLEDMIENSEEEEQLCLFREAYACLENSERRLTQKELKSLPKRTSANKVKSFPIKDFTLITNALKENVVSSKYSQSLLNWLYAGILTGLRPVEWGESIFDKENLKLIVKNAKATNMRSHGETRTLNLAYLSKTELEHIEKHVLTSNYYQNKGEFENFAKSCASLLNRIGKIALKRKTKLPSLYSLRHQFSADAKHSGYSKEEIAALMGHAVDDTATVHYAKKKSGQSLCKVIPDPDEVLRVRKAQQEQTLTFKKENDLTKTNEHNRKFIPK